MTRSPLNKLARKIIIVIVELVMWFYSAANGIDQYERRVAKLNELQR